MLAYNPQGLHCLECRVGLSKPHSMTLRQKKKKQELFQKKIKYFFGAKMISLDRIVFNDLAIFP
jgi:hypothetical protein